jgi:hypothetical protein
MLDEGKAGPKDPTTAAKVLERMCKHGDGHACQERATRGP